MQPQPRPVQIRLLQAPQYRTAATCSAESGQDASSKAGSSGAVFLVAADTEDFVQRAERQPAIRQGVVDGRDPERQHAMLCRHFEPSDMVAQHAEGGGAGHG
jgi:hypothetical protein